MRVSAKSRHAVAALVDLGIKSVHRPVALVDILDDQDISLSYLEQIFGRLKDHGLVEGVRGPRGGYRLSREAGDISVAQIVAAVEDRSFRGRKSRITGQPSEAHRIWDSLSSHLSARSEAVNASGRTRAPVLQWIVVDRWTGRQPDRAAEGCPSARRATQRPP